MRSIFPLFVLALTFATPVSALEITNLDRVDHRVRFDVAGSHEIVEVPINRTVQIAGQPGGRLSLLTAPVPKKARGAVQADGMLANVFSGARTEGIPADTNDAYVIWPGADIRLQQRWRGGKNDAR
jgi:hypothetical protein